MPIRYQVKITRTAEGDLKEIWDYIRKDSPREAAIFISRIEQQLTSLEQYPLPFRKMKFWERGTGISFMGITGQFFGYRKKKFIFSVSSMDRAFWTIPPLDDKTLVHDGDPEWTKQNG